MTGMDPGAVSGAASHPNSVPRSHEILCVVIPPRRAVGRHVKNVHEPLTSPGLSYMVPTPALRSSDSYLRKADSRLAQGEPTPSNIIPVLIAVLVCDAAVADRSTGKKNLIGIFDRVNVGKFPTQRAMTVYMRLADALGFYKTEVRYVETKTGEVLAQAEGPAQIADRLTSNDLYIDFPPLPIPREGRYEFQIWANGVYLGGTFIDAVPRAQASG